MTPIYLCSALFWSGKAGNRECNRGVDIFTSSSPALLKSIPSLQTKMALALKISTLQLQMRTFSLYVL